MLMAFNLCNLQAQVEDCNVHALIVGVSEYENINDLQYADNDALAFSEMIKCAYPCVEPFLLTDEHAKHDTLLNVLANIMIEANPNDTIIFFFSGHGDNESGLPDQPGFLLTHNTPPTNYLIASLRVNDLKSFITQYVRQKNIQVFLFIDACRAGQVSRSHPDGPKQTAAYLQKAFNNEVVVLACNPDQYSLEKGNLKHGVFTYFLVKGLEGAADLDNDEVIYLEELRRYLHDEVSSQTKKEQTPTTAGNPIKKLFVCTNGLEEEPSSLASSRFGRPVPYDNAKDSNRLGQDQRKRNRLSPEEIRARFDHTIKQDSLLSPSKDCARYYFEQYPEQTEEQRLKKEKMKMKLLGALQRESTRLLSIYTEGGHTLLNPTGCNHTIRKLLYAKSLINEQHLYYSRIGSRLLFFHGLYQHYLANPDWDEAIISYKRALIIEPFAPYVYNELGIAYTSTDSLEKAQSYLDTALSLAPNWPYPQSNLNGLNDIIKETETQFAENESSSSGGIAARIFVKTNGNGNGSSWASPLGSLHQALAMAGPGSEIWVARGEYLTTSGKDRNIYFKIPNGVKLYGGFAGTELSIAQRNIEHNPTMLSGEIGTNAKEDNAFTVVYTENVSSATVVDGFIITGGVADKELPTDVKSAEVGGGGWYNNATAGVSNPIIRNCKFIDNSAREGAGFFNVANGGEASPSIEKCQFIRNIAQLDGGAIYNGSFGGKSLPRISNCRFENNVATYGAGIMNKAYAGSLVALVKVCEFISNKAHFRGAAIYNDFSGDGASKSLLVGVILQRNLSSVGDPVSSRSRDFKDWSDKVFKSSGL